MRTTLYLLRHAHTTPCPSYAPDFDWPLDERGHAQAEALIPVLSALSIDAVYASPQQRAVETVAPFCRHAGLPLHTRDSLRESRLQQGWVEDFDALVRRHWADFDFALPGCETHRACQQRFVTALRQLSAEYPGQSLVCASGGQAIGLALCCAEPGYGVDDWAAMRRPDLYRVTCRGHDLHWDRDFAFAGVTG